MKWKWILLFRKTLQFIKQTTNERISITLNKNKSTWKLYSACFKVIISLWNYKSRLKRPIEWTHENERRDSATMAHGGNKWTPDMHMRKLSFLGFGVSFPLFNVDWMWFAANEHLIIECVWLRWRWKHISQCLFLVLFLLDVEFLFRLSFFFCSAIAFYFPSRTIFICDAIQNHLSKRWLIQYFCNTLICFQHAECVPIAVCKKSVVQIQILVCKHC